ncbi:MAG: hypothetical protein JRI23_36200 [Deltaproteobacteria bacterium]|nr:hypothetical protein [Deltaproteobacteria bacterium]MBW2537792.1 hypothetical protein [Deltaproteobacteria bacterium]
MLLRNGGQGLLLVFLVLWLFFGTRYSFWVTMGLPLDPAMLGIDGSGAMLGMFSLTSFAMVGAVLAGFFDADNDPGEPDKASPEGKAKTGKRIAAADGDEADALAEAEAVEEASRQQRRK